MKTDKKLHSIVSVAFIVLFLGLMSATVTHAETYKYVTQWGSQGSGDGQFFHEAGLAVDSSDNIYVADNNNNRTQKFDSNGTLLTKWGSPGSGDGQFNIPCDIAIDSLGNIYVADQKNHRVQKFDSKGNFVLYVGDKIFAASCSQGSGNGQFQSPCGVAVDSSDNVYVADTVHHRVQKFDSSGTFITKWGSQGSGDGQFNYPFGIDVDSFGNVYVVDELNNRVQKFDSSGTFLTKWGHKGSGDGQFNDPRGITVDSSGDIYVTEYVNNRIQKFDSSGTFITKWGSFGTGNGQFNLPAGVTVDSLGNVYVADYNNHRIQKFALEKTTPIITWNNPADIAYGTPLSDIQLNAATSIPGAFVYTPPSGTVLDAGTQNLHVDFTPTDTATYDTASKDVRINVSEKPVAVFSGSPVSGKPPLTVTFTDSSTGSPTSRAWNFGDNSFSTTPNPVHTYNKVGKYTVSLTVENVAGSNTKTISRYITVENNLRKK